MRVPSLSLLFWVQMNAVLKGQLNASVPLENIWYLQVCSIIHLTRKKKEVQMDWQGAFSDAAAKSSPDWWSRNRTEWLTRANSIPTSKTRLFSLWNCHSWSYDCVFAWHPLCSPWVLASGLADPYCPKFLFHCSLPFSFLVLSQLLLLSVIHGVDLQSTQGLALHVSVCRLPNSFFQGGLIRLSRVSVFHAWILPATTWVAGS